MPLFNRIVLITCVWILGTGLSAGSQTIEPTDEEQYLLELINRARANPPAEGEWLVNNPDRYIQFAYDYFNVDPDAMLQEFQSYPPVPPLAFNPALIEAARRHSIDMKDNRFQDHTGSDGSSGGERISGAGYDWWSYGENLYAYAESLDHAHAGFLADWGVPDLGHRKNTLEYNRADPWWEEIGIGVARTASSNLAAKRLGHRIPISPANQTRGSEDVGPVLVTIEFARTWMYTPQVLGVVYDDLNGNHFYDVSEGYGGVTVTLTGSGVSTVTYSSGGFSIPVPVPGDYVLQASGGLLPVPIIKPFTIDSRNVQVNLIIGESIDVANWTLY